MKRILFILGIAIFISALGFGFWRVRSTKQTQTSTSNPQINNTAIIPSPAPSPSPQPAGFDKAQYSLTEPTSIWAVVNKKNPLPSAYTPNDLIVPDVPLRLGSGEEQMKLRKEAGQALKEFITAGGAAGHKLMLGSGFRGYNKQKQFYDGYKAKDGQAAADMYSARPGYSEHQTGLAADIDRTDLKCHLEACLGDLPEGQWLATNAYKFGFILRYTKTKQHVTGYQYEPWHFRYVGKALAQEMHNQKIETLEEFFGLPAAPNY